MMVQLLAGMFIGCVIASIVWVYFQKSARKKIDATRREREDIMRSLGELWIEIDKLIAANRRSNFEAKGFRESFKAKIDAVNQLFIPNLHLFDVYYVKYTENLVAEYNRAVHKGEVPVDRLAATADVELETNYSVVEQSISGATPASIGTDSKTSSAPTDAAVPGVVQAAPETDLLAKDEPVDLSADSAGAVADLEIVVEEKGASQAAEPDLFELSVIADNSAPPADKKEAMSAKGNPPKEKAEPEDTIDFEAVKAPEQEFNLEIVVDKEPEMTSSSVKAKSSDKDEISFEKAPEKTGTVSPGADEAVFEAESVGKTAKSDKPASPIDEEDFSMETLIDVDINTISPFLKKDAATKKGSKPHQEEHHLFDVSSSREAPVQDAESIEIVIAPNAGHIKAPVQKDASAESPQGDKKKSKGKPDVAAAKPADTIPEETTLTRSDDLRGKGKKSGPASSAAKKEDPEAVFEMKTPAQPSAAPQPKSAQGGVSPEDIELFDKEEAIITGDDVADKIAALEFSKPSTPASPQVKKDKETDVKKDEPADVSPKQPASKSASPAPAATKGPAGAASKTKVHDDTITGDDVADKIDSFFGLFEK